MSESRAQRQAALEERKRRIAELRQARSRRAEDTARVQASATANLDDLVTGLLNEPPPVAIVEAETSAQPTTAATSDQPTTATTVPTIPAAAETSAPAVAPVASAPLPKPVETFTIGTQTDTIEESTPEAEEEEEEPEESQPSKENEVKAPTLEAAPKILSPQELEKEVTAPTFSTFLNQASKKVERMLHAESSSSSAALWKDPLAAVTAEQQQQQQAAANNSSSAETTAETLKFVSDRTVFAVDNWTSGRDITDLDWSPLSRELLLSTYTSRRKYQSSSTAGASTATNTIQTATTRAKSTPADSLTPRSGELQSDGLVAVWSLLLSSSRPEHLLTCGSPVTCGRFHPTEAPLVVGGCASGQVVVWDVRAGRLPVQKSDACVGSGKQQAGHVHALNGMAVLEGGAGFVTSSTDGKVNFWSLSNLREPAESMQIGDSLSSMAVAPESGTLLFGDDTGALQTSTTQGRRRQGVRKLEEGHFGMLTAISTQRSSSSYAAASSAGGSPQKKKGGAASSGLVKGFWRGPSGLVLTAGVDWTVQLWAPAYSDKPLTSLVSHSYDYMSDVRWSPVHPSLFATASTNGRVGLWNWGTSLEDPVCHIPAATNDAAINKIRWSADGRRLAVAADDQLTVLTWTEEALRPSKAEDDGKAMMNSFLARGWIPSRQ